jgi:hypothetical protein
MTRSEYTTCPHVSTCKIRPRRQRFHVHQKVTRRLTSKKFVAYSKSTLQSGWTMAFHACFCCSCLEGYEKDIETCPEDPTAQTSRSLEVVFIEGRLHALHEWCCTQIKKAADVRCSEVGIEQPGQSGGDEVGSSSVAGGTGASQSTLDSNTEFQFGEDQVVNDGGKGDWTLDSRPNFKDGEEWDKYEQWANTQNYTTYLPGEGEYDSEYTVVPWRSGEGSSNQ